MHFFHGDLLIGGATFRHLHGQLKLETPSPDSTEWMLAGQLQLTRQQVECLELDRHYRLELEDGRCGSVVVSRVDASEIGAIVDFEPPRCPLFSFAGGLVPPAGLTYGGNHAPNHLRR